MPDRSSALTSGQRALLDDFLGQPRRVHAIVDPSHASALARAIGHNYGIEVVERADETHLLYLWVLPDLEPLGFGLYLITNPTSLPVDQTGLDGPAGVLIESLPEPRLELTLETGEHWIEPLCYDSAPSTVLRVTAPNPRRISLIGSAQLEAIRIDRLELASEGLVVYSWRARTDLPVKNQHRIDPSSTLGDGIGQWFDLHGQGASMDFAISDEVLAVTDTLTIAFMLATQRPPIPQPAKLIRRGLVTERLTGLERHLNKDDAPTHHLETHHATGLAETAVKLASSASPLSRLASSGVHRLGEFVERITPAPDPSPYARWYAEHDADGTEALHRYLAAVTDPATISVVIPIYQPDLEFLTDTIHSVTAQSIDHWELLLSLDGPQLPEVLDALAPLVDRDSRIRIVAAPERHNIAVATMHGVEQARGDFLCFLDQDDLLHPEALAWVSAYLHARPGTKLLYTDEDKYEDGQRRDPFFKPDFSPEYLLGVNYINHLTVIERAAFSEAGGLVAGTEGAQDWDLLLRLTQLVTLDQVVHIPKVLYHWRSHLGSTAQSYNAKPEVINAQERVVTAHLQREGFDLAWLERPRSAPIFLLPHLRPTRAHTISIIIPTKDHLEDLSSCLDSILASYLPEVEILVIDNNTTDPATLAYLNALAPPIRVLRYREPFNFATMVNYGARHATGDLLLLLNNDTQVISPDWLQEMAALAERPQIGAVGAKLLYPDGSVQHCGVCLGIAGSAGHYGWSKDHRDPGDHGRGVLLTNTSAVTGAALMVERTKYLQVSGLDPELAISFNDVDLCLALVRAGYRNVTTPAAMLYHFESKSRGYNVSREQHFREDLESSLFYRRWSNVIPNDPYYSPNLSLELLEMFEPTAQPRLRFPWGVQTEVIQHPSPHISAHDSFYELGPDERLQFEVPLAAHQLSMWTRLSISLVNPFTTPGGCDLEIEYAGVIQHLALPPRLRDATSVIELPFELDRQELAPHQEPVAVTLVNTSSNPLLLHCVEIPSGLSAKGFTNLVPVLSLTLRRAATSLPHDRAGRAVANAAERE